MSRAFADAQRLQATAAAAGFDWTQIDQLWAKLAEEIEELREAVGQSPERRLDELGDLLFMVVNLARHLGVDPAAALDAANAKFARRYAHVVAEPDALPPPGAADRLDAMEARWAEAKKLGL